jgi:SPP1 family phage portal protein
MLQTGEILAAINNEFNSIKYRNAKKGLRYYEGEHDILDYKVYYIDQDGIAVEDTSKSNIKISHAYLTELINQKVSYFHNIKKDFIFSDIPELQAALKERFDDEFFAELVDVLKYGSAEGWSYLYRYLDENGRSRFNFAEGLGVCEIPAHLSSDEMAHIIYCYVEKIKDNKKLEAVLDYTNESATYYKKIGNSLMLDDRYKINPRPLILSQPDENGAIYYDQFKRIPFYRFSNNKKEFSDLKPIKGLIDDADMMACSLSNNLQDFSEGIYMVKNYQGINAEEFIQNVKTKKYVGVGADGDFDVKTFDIPYEARKVKLEMDKECIYKFGQGFDSSKVGDGNLTNIVIKSRYSKLDMKVNDFEIQVRKFLKPIIKDVIDEINKEFKTNYKYSDVYLQFERATIVNEQETITNEYTKAQTQQIKINNILGLQTLMTKEYLCQLIAEELDLDWEQVKDNFNFDEDTFDINKASEQLLAAAITGNL